MNLNERQREAVRAPGPVLVVAGPGTGKTATLAARIGHLVCELRVPAEKILAVTFTNRAASEMRRRLTSEVGTAGQAVHAGTIHSVALATLRAARNDDDLRVLDSAEQIELLRGIAVQERRAVLAGISRAKGLLMTPHDCAASDEPAWRSLATHYAGYQQSIERSGALDFDDLVSECVRVLESDVNLLAACRGRITHLLVDEYQDINFAQYRLIRLLAGEGRGLFAVGDPDQAIYAFRGADVENFLNFERDYPGARVIRLDQSYRSVAPILNAAQAVIAHNTRRMPGALHAVRAKGDRVKLVPCPDEKAHGRLIVDEIRKRVGGFSFTEVDADRHDRDADAGHGFGDFAVLYRYHAMGRSVERALREAGLPFHRVGGPTPSEHAEIRDVLAYLRLARTPEENPAFKRVVDVPPRGIGRQTVERLEVFAEETGISLVHAAERAHEVPGIPARSREALSTLAVDLRALRELARERGPAELLRRIIARFGLKDHYDDGSLDGAERYDRILGLTAAAAGYAHLPPDEAADTFLQDIGMGRPEDLHDSRADKVKVMTLHAAKGLEFPVVFLLDADESCSPPGRDAEEEEERRIFYVGLTRARDHLVIMHGPNPSGFIVELPKALCDRVSPGRPTRRRKRSGQQRLWRLR